MDVDHSEPAGGRDFFTKLTIRLYRYRALIRRRWWVLVLTIGAGLLYQAWGIYNKPVEYESQGSLNLRERVATSEPGFSSDQAQTFVATEIDTLQSPEVQERARRRLSMEAPDLSGQVRTEVTLKPRTSIFLVTGIGSDPLYTQKYVNAVMQEYISYKGEKRSANTSMTMVQIGEQLGILRREVSEERAKLQKFMEENNMPFWEQQAQTATQFLTELKTKQANLKTELRRLENLTSEQLLRSTQINPSTPGRSESSESVLAQSDTGVGGDLGAEYLARTRELIQKQAEFDERSKVWKPKHPRLLALQSDIDILKRTLETIKSQTRDSTEARIAAIKAELDSLEASIKSWEEKSLEASRKDADYRWRKEAVESKQNLLDKLTQSLQTIDVSKTMNQETLQIWQEATPANRVKTDAVRLLLIGFLVGFGIGFVILVVLDRADDRFASSTEVMDHFEEPILAQIPDVSDTRTVKGLPLLHAEDERYMLAESFRSLRSSLIFMPGDQQLKLLLVTSSTPGEGKSTCASNLAITMALAGARVLLVDADLRRGDLADLFGVEVGNGLSSVLRSEVTWKEAIHATAYPTLSLLTRGPVSNQSGELLMAPVMEKVLEEVRAAFDLVIFNTSPILATDDTPTLAPVFDGTLMVVRANYSSCKLVQRSLEMLYQRQVNVLGLILNCIDTEMPDYYYYRYPKYYAA